MVAPHTIDRRRRGVAMLSLVIAVGLPATLLTLLLGALLWVRLDTVWREERLSHWLQLAAIAVVAGLLACGLYALDPAGQPVQPAFATAVVGSLAWWARLRGWQRNEVA